MKYARHSTIRLPMGRLRNACGMVTNFVSWIEAPQWSYNQRNLGTPVDMSSVGGHVDDHLLEVDIAINKIVFD